MHQSHNIPWDIVSLNYKFERKEKHYTPFQTGISGLFPVKRVHGSQEIQHFIRKFADTIRSFSETERQKYGTQSELKRAGKLFTDELRSKYPDILNKDNQRIDYWLDKKSDPYITENGMNREYITRLFLHNNDLAPLLILATYSNRVRIPFTIWSPELIGFSSVTDIALRAYIFFNAAAAIGILDTGEYAEADNYRALVDGLAGHTDFPGQQTIHMKFLQKCGVLVDGKIDWGCDVYVHEDYGRLQGYLKELFALLYRFDEYITASMVATILDGKTSSHSAHPSKHFMAYQIPLAGQMLPHGAPSLQVATSCVVVALEHILPGRSPELVSLSQTTIKWPCVRRKYRMEKSATDDKKFPGRRIKSRL